MKTKNIILCAVFAAVLCIFSVITIPIGAVPITLAIFAVMLITIILGLKKGVISVTVYLLIGAIGLPVYAGFSAGAQNLIGPTGGYLWSYILMAAVIGIMTMKLNKNKWLAMIQIFISCIISIAICYICGTWQFTVVQNIGWASALAVCVAPFVVFDIIKAIIATYLGYEIRRALIKSGLLK